MLEGCEGGPFQDMWGVGDTAIFLQTVSAACPDSESRVLQTSTVRNFLYIPYVNHTSVLNSYITNILLFLSIITPEITFEVPVLLILGFSKEVRAHIFHGSLPLQLLFLFIP